MEEFERTVRQLKREMDELEAVSDSLRSERAGYYEEIERIKERMQKAYVIQNTAKMNIEQANARIRALKNTSEDMREESVKLNQQITDIIDNQESINVELDTSEQLESQLSAQVEEAQSLLDNERIKETAKQKEAEEIHLVCAGLEQRYEFASQNVSRIREELGKFCEEMKELEQSKGGTSREIQEKEEKIADLARTIEDSKDLFTEIREEIEKFKAQREELNQKHKVFLQGREDLSRHMSELDKEIFRLESQKSSYSEASEKQINYMWEEYELTYNRALELRNEEKDPGDQN